MSISLPNGTLLAAPSSSQQQISAAVTRILLLSKFSSDLKTRDLQAMFKDFANEKGGFLIKWIDDVSALVVFSDASVAKRAYLSFLLSPPPNFVSPATIKPYDRPDAAQIIQSLQARSMGHRSSMSTVLNPTPNTILNTDNHPQTHTRATSMNNGLSGFVMPTTHHKSGSINITTRPTISPTNTFNTRTNNNGGGMGSFSHQRTSSWSRPSILNNEKFNSNHNKLSTHIESPTHPIKTEGTPTSRSTSSSSTSNDPIVVLDPGVVGFGGTGLSNGSRFSSGKLGSGGALANRRESGGADKALNAVQRALGLGVEA